MSGQGLARRVARLEQRARPATSGQIVICEIGGARTPEEDAQILAAAHAEAGGAMVIVVVDPSETGPATGARPVGGHAAPQDAANPGDERRGGREAADA